MEHGRSVISDLEFPLTRSELVRSIGSPLQRSRFRRSRLAVALSTVVVILAGAMGGVFGWPYLVCGSGLKQVDGECVGVNDGSQSFDPGLDWITDRIHRMNTAVEDRAAEDDVEAFRIVLMGSFSLSGEADLDEEQILHAVEGAYVGIMRQNGFVETDSGIEAATEHSRIFQLYLANEGAIQQGADTVVDTLASMIDDDIPLSIVIGQSTSTTVTEQTARDLSELNIPMIAGSSTSTSINHVNSPGLIRAAPDNEDFAAALRHHLDRRVEDGHEPVQGLLLADENDDDVFSQDLADQFRRYLGPYLVRNLLTFQGSAGSGDSTVYFDHIVNEVCADPETTGVFFAGRYSDLGTFLRALELRGCRTADGDPITVYTVELGLLPDMAGSYSSAACDPTAEQNPQRYRLVQGSAFDPYWLDDEGWSPPGFADYEAAVNQTVKAESRSISTPEEFYSGYSLIYYDAATIAVRATLLGFEAGDESSLAGSVRNHLFRVGDELTGSGHLDYVEELNGRVSGRYIPILSSDCSVETRGRVPFQTPNVPYEDLYPDLVS